MEKTKKKWFNLDYFVKICTVKKFEKIKKLILLSKIQLNYRKNENVQKNYHLKMKVQKIIFSDIKKKKNRSTMKKKM